MFPCSEVRVFDMFRVQRRWCLICFVLRGDCVCYVSCSEERVCDMFPCSEEMVCAMFRIQRRGCVLYFVFRGDCV